MDDTLSWSFESWIVPLQQLEETHWLPCRRWYPCGCLQHALKELSPSNPQLRHSPSSTSAVGSQHPDKQLLSCQVRWDKDEGLSPAEGDLHLWPFVRERERFVVSLVKITLKASSCSGDSWASGYCYHDIRCRFPEWNVLKLIEDKF